MTAIGQVYKCEICGNIVAVRHAGQGQLVCCGKPMRLMGERSQDEGREKHLPVVTEAATGNDEVVVAVGSVPHPMTEQHFIEWVEVIDDQGVSSVKFLNPTDKPEARFRSVGNVVSARAYCNVHGLWALKVE